MTARGAVAGAGKLSPSAAGEAAHGLSGGFRFSASADGVSLLRVRGTRSPAPGRGASRCAETEPESSPGSAPADLLLPLPESESRGSRARHGTLDKLMRLRRLRLRKAISSLLQKILSVPPKYNAKFLSLAWFLKVEVLSVVSFKSHPFV